MSDTIPQKRCNGCKQEYPATLEYFQSDRSKQDHLRTLCKKCCKARKKPQPRKTPVVPDGYKRCPNCTEVKPATMQHFHACRTEKSGLHSWCKICCRAYSESKKQPNPNPIPEGHRQCSKCQEILPATTEFFYPAKEYAYGVMSRCKKCANEYTRNRRRLKRKPIEKLPEGQKRCSSCREIKPSTSEYFGARKTSKDGLYSRCKACTQNEKRQYLQQNREAVNQRRRERRPLLRERIAQRDRQYWHKNREWIIEKKRQHYALHKEDILKRQKMYYAANKGKRLQYSKEYRQAHKEWYIEYLRIYTRNRRARIKNIPGSHTPAQIREQLKRQRYYCYYCRSKIKRIKGKYVYHVDHTIPITRTDLQPRNEISHLVLTCPHCNQSKGNKCPWEFPEGGRLL